MLNNASMIDFAATAGQVRDTFHTELHYFNIRGGKYPANVKDPEIPAALAPVVAGIKGLIKIPAHTNHTPIRQASYDAHTHRWHTVDTAGEAGAKPAFDDPDDWQTWTSARKTCTPSTTSTRCSQADIWPRRRLSP